MAATPSMTLSGPESRSVALGAFFARVRERALRIAWIEVRDHTAALDLVQDAMLRLVDRYGQHPPEEWPPLFYRILRNRIVDWQRHRRVEGLFAFIFSSGGEDGDDERPVDFADPGPDPESRLMGAQLARHIADALAQLPRRQRETFLLREWEGLSVAEAALAMGVSEGSVKTHHFRALSRLRELLRDDDPREESHHGTT